MSIINVSKSLLYITLSAKSLHGELGFSFLLQLLTFSEWLPRLPKPKLPVQTVNKEAYLITISYAYLNHNINIKKIYTEI